MFAYLPACLPARLPACVTCITCSPVCSTCVAMSTWRGRLPRLPSWAARGLWRSSSRDTARRACSRCVQQLNVAFACTYATPTLAVVRLRPAQHDPFTAKQSLHGAVHGTAAVAVATAATTLPAAHFVVTHYTQHKHMTLLLLLPSLRCRCAFRCHTTPT